MGTGLQIIGSHGIVQIDETYRNLSLRAKGTIVGNVSFANSVSPLLAYSTLNTNGAMTHFVGISGSTYTWAYRSVPTSTTYYVFDVPIPAGGAAGTNVGFQVLNASGQVVFDANNDYMKIVGVYFMPYPGGGALASVTQPSGSTYAFVHVDSGQWTRDQATGLTDVGGYQVYMDGSGQFRSAYSVQLFTQSGPFSSGPVVDARQAQIMVINVTGCVPSG